jgi:membrane protein
LRGSLGAVGAICLLSIEILLLTLLGSLLHPGLLGSILLYGARAGLAVPLLLALQYVLLGRRIPARDLLAGSVALAVGQTLVSVGSKVWMPHVVAHNAERYGVIGVTFALLSWLVLLAVALVAGVATSAELSSRRGTRRRGREKVPAAAPAAPTPTSPTAPDHAEPALTDPALGSRSDPPGSIRADVPAPPPPLVT